MANKYVKLYFSITKIAEVSAAKKDDVITKIKFDFSKSEIANL